MKTNTTLSVISLITLIFAVDTSRAQQTPPREQRMDHSKMNHAQMKPMEMNHDDMKQDASPQKDSAVADNSGATGSQSMLSEKEHVPPDSPQLVMGPMSTKDMQKMMEMDDTRGFGRVLVDELEWRAGSNAAVWNAQGWYGNDYNKLWFKTEGERTHGATDDARVEALWDRIVARWWSTQVGARYDVGKGPSRTWAAIGVQGIAPYWFDLEATLYVGEAGRAAARLKAEYEVLFSQRLILQPEAELNVYSKEDRERNIGSGLSDFEFSLRLRYEFRREFAPYVGATWVKRLGNTADFARLAGEDADEVRAIAGVRLRF